MNEKKQCRHCQNDLPIDDFAPHNKTKDRRQAWCKKCIREYALSRYRKIADSDNERRRKYYKDNK